jgi:glycosyltransferase involved in cell wall biosynthesis
MLIVTHPDSRPHPNVREGDDGSAPSFIRDLRLLMVADTASTHTHRWASHFLQRGARITILSCHNEPVPGADVIYFPGRRRWYHAVPKVRMLMDYLPFQRLVRDIDPQLVHFHFISEGGRAFYWDRIGVPMVASSWGQDVIFDNGPNPRAEKSLRRMLSHCRQVTATTHQLAEATLRYMPPGKNVHVIPFGVDLGQFTLRQERENDDAVIGFVKHLMPKYGPDVLVEAFALIHKARPRTRLVIAGRGPMERQLKERVAELGLSSAVELTGRIPHDQVPALMRQFDISAMPSVYDSESFGVAAIEASATGIPVVASRVGGVSEAVVHGKTGLLVPPRDPAALANACIELIDDPALRRRMGMAGRRFVELNYIWQDNARQMEEVYRAALTGDEPQGIPVYRGAAPELAVPE